MDSEWHWVHDMGTWIVRLMGSDDYSVLQSNILAKNFNVVKRNNPMEEVGTIVIPSPSPEELKPTIPYMNNLIRLSRLINMWPNDNKTNPFLYHLRTWLTVTYSLSMILSFGIGIIENIKNVESIAILMDFITAFTSGLFRYIYIYVRSEKYLLLVSLMHNNFIQYSLFPKENRLSLIKYYKIANKISKAYCTFIVFWVLQVVISQPLSYAWKISKLQPDSNETIPYPVITRAYAPFDYDTQPNNLIFYVYQFFGYMILCWTYIMSDSFWFTVIILTIGQLALLKDSMETISEILNKDNSGEGFQLLKGNDIQTVEVALKHCIRHHQFTREFIRLVENIINPVLLADTLHVMISVAFILLDVIVAMDIKDWNKFMYSLEYFITSIFHMFVFDWLGNELAVQEEEVADIVHKIPWYKCPTQKPLLMVLSLQARKPYKLTGGGMFILSLDFFINTLKADFSVFTFLQNMRK